MSSREDLRQAALSGFSAASLGLNDWIYSVGAERDTRSVLSAIQDGENLKPFTPATSADRYHTASMRIMQSICRALNFGEGEQPVVWRELDGVDNLYSHASEVLASINLDFDLSGRVERIKQVVGSCIEGYTAASPQAQLAKDTWHARGTITEKQVLLEDMKKALENETDPEVHLESIGTIDGGGLVTVSSLPTAPSRPVEIPFYRQYVSATRGGHEYLQAYLEDIVSLNEKLITA